MVRSHPPLPGFPTPPHDPIPAALAELLDAERPAAGERWLVAFSGGPDSTALAATLAPLAAERQLALHLVHVDHALDAGSAARAGRAAELAGELGLAIDVERVDVPALRDRHESPESAARRLRYAVLERRREAAGARLVLTAHHRDDQVETLLLQLARGVPLERLTGIAPARGALRRPLIDVPRTALRDALAARRIVPIDDPTNRDRRYPRNRLRHQVLPRLRPAEPGLEEALLALALRTRRLRNELEHRFALEQKSGPEWIRSLPAALQLSALRWLLQECLGSPRSPSLPSLESFLASVRRGGTGRLRLPSPAEGDLVASKGRLRREPPKSHTPPFTYSFLIPGEVELPELGRRLRVRLALVEPWMFRGDPQRAALAGNATRATVRSRRPGDRLRPLGAPGARKLKELLIDRRIPARERDRLPLVELDGRLAWVPGVAIDDAFRLRDETECWVAEWIPAAPALAEGEGRSERTSTT